ncbi:hypothetical protein JCM13580A_05030 [Streptomyces drozdowiczii]
MPVRYGETDAREAAEDRAQRDLRLGPGERRAQAAVDAVAEPEVRGRVPVQVEPARVREALRVAVGRTDRDQDRDARRDLGAAERDGLRGEPERRRAHRRVEPDQLVHRTRDELRSRTQPPKFGRVPEQREQRVAERVGRGLVTRDEQQHAQRDQLPLAQPVGPVPRRDEAVEEGGAGGAASGCDEPRHVVGDGVRGRVDDVRGPRREQVGGPAPDVGPVGLGHAEQFADHGHRERYGQSAHEVERRAPGPPVEEFTGDPCDEGAQCGDGPRGERPGHQLPQPGVIRRVGGQHGAGDRRVQSAPRLLAREEDGGVLGEPGIVESRPRLRMTRDQVTGGSRPNRARTAGGCAGGAWLRRVGHPFSIPR